MTIIVTGMLCIILTMQILKIIMKSSIINKNIIDYIVEYIVANGGVCRKVCVN